MVHTTHLDWLVAAYQTAAAILKSMVHNLAVDMNADSVLSEIMMVLGKMLGRHYSLIGAHFDRLRKPSILHNYNQTYLYTIYPK